MESPMWLKPHVALKKPPTKAPVLLHVLLQQSLREDIEQHVQATRGALQLTDDL